MEIQVGSIKLHYFKDGNIHILFDDIQWRMNQGKCKIVFNDQEVLFESLYCEQKHVKRGIGEGICNRYYYHESVFETYVWIESISQAIYFELNPIHFELDFDKIYWPNAFEFEKADENWISLVNQMQGIMVPNTYENEFTKLNFNGMFCSNAAYMPWFGQIKDHEGYLMIQCTPWDSGYEIDHPRLGPYTHLTMYHLPSLSKLAYRRVMKLILKHDANIVSLCKEYRKYANEEGKIVTLNEKACRNPQINQLIGSAFLHKGIKTHVCMDSKFYDFNHPEKNDHLVTFHMRAKEIEYFHSKGIQKLYLHLDGWGNPGYDNAHPDYLPACIEAGGWEGLKELSDTIDSYHDMLGLHDQYRDYYKSASSFDENQALMMKDKTIFQQAIWAGGEQSYLCASLAPNYVKRNFETILSHNIHLAASYLDVFTCNELDECFNEQHLMSRYECMKYREQ
ncbi:MAG: endo-alpha-N-acetylgalactosaminidase family protein, partial [Traorella sp.]